MKSGNSFISGFVRVVMSRGFRFGACFREFVVLGLSLFPVRKNNSLTCLRHVCSLKWAAKVTVKELFYSNLDRLACRSSSVVFLREKSRLFVLFVTARPVWNVVLFSSGRKVSCLNRLSPLDEFGTLCRFPQGGKTLFVYHHSTGRLVWLPAARRS